MASASRLATGDLGISGDCRLNRRMDSRRSGRNPRAGRAPRDDCGNFFGRARGRRDSPSRRDSGHDQSRCSIGSTAVGSGCVHAGFRIRATSFPYRKRTVPTAKSNRLVVLGCDQLFQRTELRRRGRRRLGKAIDSFLDLRSWRSDCSLVARNRSLPRIKNAGQG